MFLNDFVLLVNVGYLSFRENCLFMYLRALGDLTQIKKHYSHKHGEKMYKCGNYSKRYNMLCDWEAQYSKICGIKNLDVTVILSSRGLIQKSTKKKNKKRKKPKKLKEETSSSHNYHIHNFICQSSIHRWIDG